MGFWKSILPPVIWNAGAKIYKDELREQQIDSLPNRDAYNSWEYMSGVSKEEDEAAFVSAYMRHSWVYVCVNVIARSGAGVPFLVYDSPETKKIITHKEEPFLRIFERPNPFDSFYDLVEGTLIFMGLTGDAYWEKVGDPAAPIALYLLQSDKVTPVPSRKAGPAEYIYKPNQTEFRFSPDQLVHFKYFNPRKEIQGLSPARPLTNSLVSDFYAMSYNKEFFKRGGRIEGCLSVDGTLTTKERERLHSEWSQMYEGASGRKTAVLEKGMKYERTSATPKDAEFSQSRKSNREEILGAYGVPPVLVGVLEHASYANAKEQKRAFWENTEIPILTKLQWTITNDILRRKNENWTGEFDLTVVEALKESEETRATIQNEKVKIGRLTINEARAEDGLGPVPWGDVWYAPLGTSPIGKRAKENPKDALRKAAEKEWLDFFKVQEDFFAKVMRQIFADQKDTILKKFSELSAENKIEKVDIAETIFDVISQSEKMKKRLKPLYITIMGNTGKRDKQKFNFTFDFVTSDPIVVEWVGEKAGAAIKMINETTLKSLRETLGLGMDAGETIRQLTDRIQKLFDDADSYRAGRIAQTEVISATNKTHFLYYSGAGVEKKSWMTVHDAKVRHSHLAAEAQGAIPINENFSNGLSFPGDPSGPAEEVIECRCALNPEFD